MKRMLLQRLSAAIAVTLLGAVALGPAGPLEAQQSRFRVLVPSFEPLDGAKRGWGEDVAKELRKQIDDMPTHAAVSSGDMRDALRKYDLNARDMTCIQWRQLAVQMQVELVSCGSYRDIGGGTMVVNAHFQGARTGEPFQIGEFETRDARAAASTVFQAFESYVNQLRLATFCLDYLRSQQYENALRNCEQALELNPNAVTALYGRAEAMMRMAEALEGGAAAPELGEGVTEGETPDASAIPVDGLEGGTNGEHSEEYLRLMQESLEGFEHVLEVNPIHENALVAAGFVATKLGQHERALGYYERLLELDPGNVDVRLQRATDLARAGNPAGALRLAEEGFEHAEDNISLREYAGHFALAAAQKAAQAGEPEATELFNKALDHYRTVFEAKGAEAEAVMLRNMLATLTQLERYQEALELGSRFVEAKPDDAPLWLAYGDALARANRLDDALAALERASELDPSMPNLAPRRAQWLLNSGQLARARETLRSAVSRGELSGDQAANMIFGYGYTERYQRGQQDAALDLFALAREFATSPELKARSNFFTGYVLFQRAKAMYDRNPNSAAMARNAKPLFERALGLFQGAGAYREQAGAIQNLISGTRQYLEIMDALLKRG